MDPPEITLEMPDNLYNLLKNHFITTLESFIREIELSFDYIDSKILNNINVEKMKNNDIFFKQTIQEINLEEYKHSFHINPKPKTKDFDFMNQIIFLGLPFKLFENENKNTKKTLINYLLQFYTTIKMISGDSPDDVLDFITKNISKNNNSAQLTKALNKLNKPTAKMMEPLQNLMNNKEIMNIAQELTADIAQMNIDPMAMLSSMMSGMTKGGVMSSGNPEMNEFINKVTNKITTKIQNGDIDTGLLEQHAQKFMKTFTE